LQHHVNFEARAATATSRGQIDRSSVWAG